MIPFEVFLHKVFDALGSQGRCFQSGALVINIGSRALRDYFMTVIAQGRRRPLGGRTHQAFAKRYRKLTDQYDVRIRGSFCGAPKSVAMVYLFSRSSTAYAYVKLETHPARSAGHARDAAGAYLVKRRNFAADPHARRETARRTAAQEARNASAWQSEERANGGYDRVGAEVYVPRSVAEHFLGM